MDVGDEEGDIIKVLGDGEWGEAAEEVSGRVLAFCAVAVSGLLGDMLLLAHLHLHLHLRVHDGGVNVQSCV